MTSRALVETYAQFPFTVTDGEGALVRDDSGREYWDLYGGHAVALLGHSHPAVTRAVSEQAARLTFYSNAVPLEVRDRAADKLCAFAGPKLDQVFFCNSGAEANENALKVAVQQTGRTRIAALEGAFHGRTMLALSATWSPKLRKPFESMLAPVTRLRPNEVDDIGLIDERVAAVIVEPILSMAGIVSLEAEFLRALRERCDEVGALLVYDEVQTGMGRLGRPFAAGQHGVHPDMVTLAKGIANGIPMGATLVSGGVAARIALGDMGSTFGGGPVACAALEAVLDTIEAEGLVAAAADLGSAIAQQLCVGPVEAVSGQGCLVGLKTRGEARPLHAALLERGFITGTSADPKVLRLLPPINTPREAIGALAAALKDCWSQARQLL